jgi:hypothetical protein
MPQLKPDSILNEYSFTAAEEINVKVLSVLQIAWLQNKYATIFKQKAATIVPNEAGLDRDYLLALGELEGRLSMLQELFLDHQDALALLKDPEFKQSLELNGNVNIDDLAARAAKQVDQN